MATNLLQDGAVWLGDRLKESAGRSVTYSRKGVSVTVTACAVRVAEYQADTGQGFVEVQLGRDFVFSKADLVIAEKVIDPKAGDTITLDGDDYKVFPLSDGASFDPHDGSETQIVVHTKRIRNG